MRHKAPIPFLGASRLANSAAGTEQTRDAVMTQWKQIEEFDGYFVSETGQVKHVENGIERELSPCVHSKGYLRVNISVNGVNHTRRIHRLVASAFIPNPENKPQVNHKNGNKQDNSVENLEWVTGSENILHAYRSLSIRNPRAKLTCEQVSAIKNSTETSTVLGKRFGVDPSTILKVRRGESFAYGEPV